MLGVRRAERVQYERLQNIWSVLLSPVGKVGQYLTLARLYPVLIPYQNKPSRVRIHKIRTLFFFGHAEDQRGVFRTKSDAIAEGDLYITRTRIVGNVIEVAVRIFD